MVTANDINWGSYLEYEGPFFRGKVPFELQDKPTAEQRELLVLATVQSGAPRAAQGLMAVINATEGGRFDAINMYDRCIDTAGLIQWCEAGQYSVSDLLGVIADADRTLLDPLRPALEASKAEFKRGAKGRYRFFFLDERGEVSTIDEQRQLFLLSSTGHKGTWDDASRAHARLWAACQANVLAQPAAQELQLAFTLPRLHRFVMPEARAVLFDEDLPDEGWVGALRAAFLSFAANIPLIASRQLTAALGVMTAPKWSREYCITVLRQLTFGPQIAIYPKRYEAIRPVLERLYGVDLPDFAEDLRRFQASMGADALDSVEAIQRELVAEGYDLGPKGADGVMGSKTRAAILTFQRLHGLEADGLVGPKTMRALLEEAAKRR